MAIHGQVGFFLASVKHIPVLSVFPEDVREPKMPYEILEKGSYLGNPTFFIKKNYQEGTKYSIGENKGVKSF